MNNDDESWYFITDKVNDWIAAS